MELNVGRTCAVVNVTRMESSGELQLKRTVATSTLKMVVLSYVPPKCWYTPSRLCGVIFQKPTMWIFKVVEIPDLFLYMVLMNVTSDTTQLSYTHIWVITAIHHLLSYWLAWDYWRFSSAGQTDVAHILYRSVPLSLMMVWNAEDLSLLGPWHCVVR